MSVESYPYFTCLILLIALFMVAVYSPSAVGATYRESLTISSQQDRKSGAQRRRSTSPSSTTTKSKSPAATTDDADEDPKPNHLTLAVQINSDGQIKLNQDEAGSLSNLGRLRTVLERVIQERVKNHAYRRDMFNRPDVPESARIERRVEIYPGATISPEQVNMVVEAISEAGAEPSNIWMREDYTKAAGRIVFDTKHKLTKPLLITVIWREQEMMFTLPVLWHKDWISIKTYLEHKSEPGIEGSSFDPKITFRRLGPDETTLRVDAAEGHDDITLEAALDSLKKDYYNKQLERQKKGELDEVRYLELDSVTGVLILDSKDTFNRNARLSWLAYRKYKGRVQYIQLGLDCQKESFAQHRDEFDAILHSVKLKHD